MKKFSARKGYKPVKSTIQINSIDDELQNSLWNNLIEHYFYDINDSKLSDTPWGLFTLIWRDYFKKPLDEGTWSAHKIYGEIKKYFFECEWFEVYDFIEFIANNDIQALKFCGRKELSINESFILSCNNVLERELSGYRFVGSLITEITYPVEINEIEKALYSSSEFKSVAAHIEQSHVLLSDRKNPDFRNSIKESISAVETICKMIINKPNATLGQALKEVENKIPIHPALKEGFSKLYGYTSSPTGIRHSFYDLSVIEYDDALYFLVVCSAFINYLKSKSSKAGIKFS